MGIVPKSTDHFYTYIFSHISGGGGGSLTFGMIMGTPVMVMTMMMVTVMILMIVMVMIMRRKSHLGDDHGHPGLLHHRTCATTVRRRRDPKEPLVGRQLTQWLRAGHFAWREHLARTFLQSRFR